MKKILFIILFFVLLGSIFKTSTEHEKKNDQEKLSKKNSLDSKIISTNFQDRVPAGRLINKKSLVFDQKKKNRTSQNPLLDAYPRVKLNLGDLFVLSNLVAEYHPRSLLKITEVAGVPVYEDINGQKNNVIFDASRGLYCVWTGIISLSAESELAIDLASRFPLNYQESIGPIHLYQMSEGFDLTKHLPDLMNIEGVGDVSLDLNYANVRPR